jgi:Flp pilus assembly secretin CpaC
MVFIEARRLILMNCWCRGTYRALVSAMLLASGQAQTPPSVPVATAPAAASVRSVYVSTLPDATTALTSSTRSASQSLHVLVGRSLFIKSVSRLKRVYVSNPVAVDYFT